MLVWACGDPDAGDTAATSEPIDAVAADHGAEDSGPSSTDASADAAFSDTGTPVSDAAPADVTVAPSDTVADAASADTPVSDAALSDGLVVDSADLVDVPETADVSDVSGSADTASTADANAPDANAPDTADADAAQADAAQADADAPDTEVTDAGPPVPLPTKPPQCDAGDAAWVRRAMLLLAGRYPAGSRETAALVQHVQFAGRAATARAMLREPGFSGRWSRHIFDLLEIERSIELPTDCVLIRHQPTDKGAIAATIRDHGPLQTKVTGKAGMLDVVFSSLALDDLTAALRVGLFVRMLKPSPFCGNASSNDTAVARRVHFGRAFWGRWLRRQLDCVPCHNSKFAVSDSADPALDRHWPLPGAFEKALFGANTGRPESEVYAVFRYRGVVSKQSISPGLEQKVYPADNAPPVRPWGLLAACGLFIPPAKVAPDPLKVTGYLGGKLADPPSIWTLQALVQSGIAGLASTADLTDTAAIAKDPPRALAWMMAQRLVDAVWTIAHGSRLTLAHGFARNVQQRDKLAALTALFVKHKWSLRELLVAITTDPWFNGKAPSDGCGGALYPYPPVLNPFSIAESDSHARGNSMADGWHRVSVHALLPAALWALALGPLPEQIAGTNGTMIDTASILARLGAWPAERQPALAGASSISYAMWRLMTRTGTFSKDAFSSLTPPQDGKKGDWVDQLYALANATPGATVRDAVRAARDRFWGDAVSPAAEEKALSKLFAVDLATPVTQTSGFIANLGAWVGVMLDGPRFTMAGVPWADATTYPKLNVGGLTTLDHCKGWLDKVWPAKDQPAGVPQPKCTAAGIVK